MRRRMVHVLTPGDHFSPGTGSAVASVVHGLASASEHRPVVLVAEGTYPERYPSADVEEYPLLHAPHGAPRRVRVIDLALGRAGLPRPWAQRVWGQTVACQREWDPSWLIGHNAPQLVPQVTEVHLPVLYTHNDVLGTYSRREVGRTLDRVHRVVAVSDFLAARLSDRMPTRLRDRLRVVPNGVDADYFNVPRGPRSGSLRVGFVGRVIRDKGVHVLLEAAAKTGRPDISVTVIGSAGFSAAGSLTRYERELRRFADGVAGPVKFVPFQRRDLLPRLLADLDVVVVPSVRIESFPLVVMEGMAAGAAVVASDIGGVSEAAGGAGILVPPGDASALAEALVGLADSSALLDSTATAGRDRVRRASWEASATQLVEALKS